MVLRNRALVLIAGSAIFFQRPWRLAVWNMARLDTSAANCNSFYCEQSPLPAQDAHPYLLCILAAWISPRCGALMGVTAGFCEEVLFRGFLMTEFAKAGYGKGIQIFIPGLAFGLSHAGYLSQGFLPWLGIAVPVACIGMIWGSAYLLGRRSLIPAVVAHFLNDATALPWIMFFYDHQSLTIHSPKLKCCWQPKSLIEPGVGNCLRISDKL